ncbi:DUF4349 domain-containing protein [Agrococcus sp. ARC_14]|uniref:DUF4349 domain-containing protein n=1 Tax=Agrococcus sp. ARC_14 TaxID=2919927 RepID=UPI001F0648AA|nr:DUF4349 domain-containing protein [Agrococcus sp. ARC_14]MCH1883902.1 DUF4349 domain-containing protein [Agrococcus sp. ARC_14]
MTRRLLSMAGIVIAGTVLLTGCGAMGAGNVAYEPSMGSYPDSGGAESQQDESAGDGDMGASGGEPGQVAADEDRAVIVTGSVAMRAGDPLQVADAVTDATEARGGTIDRRAEGASTDFEPAWATLTVRVPAVEVDGMLDALRGLGEVTTLDLGEEVVTNQVRDLEVRVNASRASVERLTELLTTAADTETLLEVEAQLTQRTSELESLLSQQRALEEQVAMSTLEVQIRSTTVEGPTGTPSFWDGLVNGWNGFLAWGATFLFGFGQAIPALVILAVVGLIAWLVIRRIVKRMPARTTPVEGSAVVNPVVAAESERP